MARNSKQKPSQPAPVTAPKAEQRKKDRPRPPFQRRRMDEMVPAAVSPTVTKTDTEKSSLNDVSWYSRYPSLLSTTANITFPYRPGMVVHRPDVTASAVVNDKTVFTDYSTAFSVPGVAVLEWAPSVGDANEWKDPINVAALEYYAKVRAGFSGNIEADAPDFMVYLMALDSVFSYIAWLKRLYRLTGKFSPDNYMVPNAILAAMGFFGKSVTAMQSNRNRFLAIVDELCYMVRKLRCPDTMDIFRRHYWMNDNVYSDAATYASQLYLFDQKFFYQFALLPIAGDNSGNKAGGLTLVPGPVRTATDEQSGDEWLETLFTFGADLINALATSDDAYKISGYLTTAFKDKPVFVVKLLSEESADLTFEYQTEVLSQIENSRTIPYYTVYAQSDGISADVQQSVEKNVLVCAPTFSRTIAPTTVAAVYKLAEIKKQLWDADRASGETHLLNLHHDHTTAADVAVASRLHAFCEPINLTSTKVEYAVHAGTEIPLRWVVKANSTATSMGLALYQDWFLDLSDSTAVALTINALKSISQITAFDWFPQVELYAEGVNPTGLMGANCVFCDFQNVTNLTAEQQRLINRQCIFSEFNAFPTT